VWMLTAIRQVRFLPLALFFFFLALPTVFFPFFTFIFHLFFFLFQASL